MGGLGPGALDSLDPLMKWIGIHMGYPDSNPKPLGPKPSNESLVETPQIIPTKTTKKKHLRKSKELRNPWMSALPTDHSEKKHIR